MFQPSVHPNRKGCAILQLSPLKLPQQAPIIFNKSLLNVYNRFCYTNCLKCFSHFHMLTHSLKISSNPSLVAGFFFPESSGKLEHESKKGTKYFKQTLVLNGAKSPFATVPVCLEIPDLPFYLFVIKRQDESYVLTLQKATCNRVSLFMQTDSKFTVLVP